MGRGKGATRTGAAEGASLGPYLRALRAATGLTLRQVEGRCKLPERCGVSNAYLSQLERGRVREPSPRVLWALAECYGADYAELLRLAGYPLPPTADGAARAAVVFAGAERLTAEEREEIQAIITLKLRRRRGGPGAGRATA